MPILSGLGGFAEDGRINQKCFPEQLASTFIGFRPAYLTSLHDWTTETDVVRVMFRRYISRPLHSTRDGTTREILEVVWFGIFPRVFLFLKVLLAGARYGLFSLIPTGDRPHARYPCFWKPLR